MESEDGTLKEKHRKCWQRGMGAKESHSSFSPLVNASVSSCSPAPLLNAWNRLLFRWVVCLSFGRFAFGVLPFGDHSCCAKTSKTQRVATDVSSTESATNTLLASGNVLFWALAVTIVHVLVAHSLDFLKVRFVWARRLVSKSTRDILTG